MPCVILIRRSLLAVLFALLAGVAAHAGTLAQFRTVFGDIDVELYDQGKPVTVANFIRYVKSGAYEGMFIHRCIPEFVAQGGGFLTTNRYDFYPFTNVFQVPTFPPITNEFRVGPRLSNSFGTISMAQFGTDPNSATSQWFFNTADNSSGQPNDLDALNGGFAVFGRMLRGTNVLDALNFRAPGFGIIQLGGAFNDLPVNYYDPFSYPAFSDLIYVDITLLNVQVRRTNNVREISWNSVANRPHLVQFTTNFPPAWQTLLTTNGNGQLMKFTDTSTGAPRRFYRVRVDY